MLIICISGLAYLLVLWAVLLMSGKRDFSFLSLMELHRFNLSLYLAEFVPVIVFIAYFIFHRKIAERETYFTQNLDKYRLLLERYSDQAKRIGTGDFMGEIETEGPDDKLGNALIVMQSYLRSNLRKERDMTWITEGKDTISRLLRNYTNISELADQVLKSLINYIEAVQGVFYLYDQNKNVLSIIALYAYNRRRYVSQEFKIGQGLVGECAYEMDFVYRTEIPEDYITITSGILGDRKPSGILLVPLIADGILQGVMEFAFLKPKVPKLTIQFLLELGEIIGRTVFNLKLSLKTQLLLEESRQMTEELKQNEKELQENAAIMVKTQEELKRSNEQLEAKILEVQNAQGRMHWLLENSSEVISIYDNEFNLAYVSPSVTRILGYSPGEIMKGKDFERMSAESARQFRGLLEKAMDETHPPPDIQYSFIKKDGERVFLESSAKNLLQDPAIKGIIVNTKDITEKIRAEREERLKTRMQSLSENSLDIIIRISTSGHFYYANPVVEDYIHFEPKKIINKSLSELEFVKVLKDYFSDAIIKMTENPRKLNTEIPVPVRMGEKLTERIISFDAIPEFSGNELETVLFVGHDITEAKHIAKEVEIKNKNIGDSINYAKRIQSALLPDMEVLRKFFPKSFVLYKPRDVVSGDFPWFYAKKTSIYIAAIDCTGHGVPGALLSFIGYFILNNIIEHEKEFTASEILDKLHQSVRQTLKQDTDKSEARDGMDIAFCKINPEKFELQFAGAHRSLYLLSEGELTEFKGTRKSIGGMLLGKRTEEDFVNNIINYRQGDKIFFFTDGFSDQLGGPYGRKYSTKRIRDLILENPGYTMQQYNSLFMDDFSNWQKGFRQLDDLLMIGIEF